MIVQTAPQGSPNFVIEQTDHALTCGQLARAFGNAAFSLPAPQALLVYVVEHHDSGWSPVDALAEQSATTGLPHHLTQTPLAYLLQTSQGSPDFNETYHPFCGLLSSMHTYGLFNGRYGLSDFIFIDRISPEYKTAVNALLDAELQRQERLKQVLGADSQARAWIDPPALFDHYKLLQFFDTLALYFQTNHAGARSQARLLNVPDGTGQDHTITISPRSDGAYTLSPWVFAGESVEVFVEGRWLNAEPAGTDFKQIFARTPKEKQSYLLVKS